MSLVQRLRLGIFALIAVSSVVFAGVEYVGIPQRYLGQAYEVSVNLPDSGGIFENAEVTMRGVAVGRVKSLHLTQDGVRADLRIDKGVEIPTNSMVKVSNLSAVGEQYINLLPPQKGGPYLAAGAALPVSAATTPLKVTALLVHLDRLATSIGKPQLRLLVSELGRTFADSGQDLTTVLTQTRALTASLREAQPRATQLINDGDQVLRTQLALAAPLQELARSLDQLTETLARNDPSIRTILNQGPQTLDATRKLLRDNQAGVGVLLGNLLTVSEIVAEPIRQRALIGQLVLLPRVIQGTFVIQPGDGFARLGAVVDSSQAVCTDGYESSGTPPAQGTQLSKVPGNPSLRGNLNAFCASDPDTTGIGVRGATSIPRPPGDTTATVIPQPNPRGFGPGSSFANSSQARVSTSDPDAVDLAQAEQPGSIRMLPPTDLRGLLLKKGLS